MTIVLFLGILALAYVIGSIPFGWLVVRLTTGKDIRKVESGRTGGTNAMRAAGVAAGIATAVLDALKAASTVWLAQAVLPDNIWLRVLAPVAAVIGHNYSIFLLEKKANGSYRLRGGAGGAPTVGGAFGLWPVTSLIIVPIAALIFYGIGYASVTTMSAALIATLIFAWRAALGLSPWEYVLYGVLTEILLIIALRPNIQRLMQGTERVVGWRARRAKSSHAPQTGKASK